LNYSGVNCFLFPPVFKITFYSQIKALTAYAGFMCFADSNSLIKMNKALIKKTIPGAGQ